ncbi:alpha/beta hydrolase [Bremerella cremea]|uniref:Alpha/beta hydrolase n=2 Tax=Pirellulales TaxID=2691354 RepID=A0A2S8FEM6_9BACT|nr:alpha/beta hydrolase [Blastopirellula marina]RCS43893.1 alpha/beta hydrolase [Bremerella cremea]
MSVFLDCLLTSHTEGAVTEYTDVVFAKVGGHSLMLDIFLPESTSNTDGLTKKPQLLMWIHGGGWRSGSRKRVPLKTLTEHGYAVASISYRLTDVDVFPAQIHDCKAAVRWLRANADRYGYDATKIFVGGSSAGGHLALLLGVSAGVDDLEGKVGGNLDQSSAVQAVVDFFGPSDFELRGKTQPEIAYSEKAGSFALLGGLKSGKITPEAERFASPATYVTKNAPPLLIFHGSNDKRVLIDQSKRMETLYNQLGLSGRLVIVQDAGHGGPKFFTPERIKVVLDFFDRQLQR